MADTRTGGGGQGDAPAATLSRCPQAPAAGLPGRGAAPAWRRWVFREDDPLPGRCALFCFPCAGSGASPFLRWRGLFPDWTELVPVQLPGRETRAQEPLPERAGELMEAMALALAPLLAGDFAFWGHSMGGLLACRFAGHLEATGRAAPVHLFLTGSPPPVEPDRGEPPARTPDDLLRLSDGIPREARESPALMEEFLRVATADCRLLMDIRSGMAPVHVPATLLAGDDDPLAPAGDMPLWEPFLGGGYSLRVFPGGHFFPRQHREAVAALIADTLFFQLFEG